MIDDLDKTDTDFALWPQNKLIVDAFVAVQTQWRVVPLGSAGRLYFQGLDYVGARAGLAAEDIVLTPAQWTLLRIMEGEAASALNGYRG